MSETNVINLPFVKNKRGSASPHFVPPHFGTIANNRTIKEAIEDVGRQLLGIAHEISKEPRFEQCLPTELLHISSIWERLNTFLGRKNSYLERIPEEALAYQTELSALVKSYRDLILELEHNQYPHEGKVMGTAKILTPPASRIQRGALSYSFYQPKSYNVVLTRPIQTQPETLIINRNIHQLHTYYNQSFPHQPQNLSPLFMRITGGGDLESIKQEFFKKAQDYHHLTGYALGLYPAKDGVKQINSLQSTIAAFLYQLTKTFVK